MHCVCASFSCCKARASYVSFLRRLSILALATRAILFAAEYEGDNQGVNSDSFGECQTNEHIDTDQRLCFRIATDGAECLTCGDTDTNAGADGSQTDGERYCKCIDCTCHDDEPP